jgi:hypothetical protein
MNLHFKNQIINTVQESNHCILQESHKTQKYMCRENSEFENVKQ